MANGSRFNGNVKAIIAIIMLAAAVSGWAWGIGRGAVEDSVEVNTEQIGANTDSIRNLEKSCAGFEVDLHNIKQQLEKQDQKLDKILDKL